MVQLIKTPCKNGKQHISMELLNQLTKKCVSQTKTSKTLLKLRVENVFIWSLHFYKVNIKEETNNTANCFIQPRLMPFRLTVSLILTHYNLYCTHVIQIIKA